MDKLEKIFEECIGLNAELGYVPIKKEDVIEVMKRAYNQALEDVKTKVRIKKIGNYGSYLDAGIDKESIDKLKIK